MKIAIAFTFDNKFCTPAYVAIKSLILSAKSSTSYTIIIYYWNIPAGNLKKFNSLVENTNHEIIYLKADKNEFNGFPITRTWSYSVYLRLLLPNVLPQYDKIIYSDVDVFFLDDLSDLYSYDIEDYQLGGVAAECRDAAQVHQVYPEYANEYIFWSGLLLMNLKKLRQENFVEHIRTFVSKYKNRLKMFDLELLNLACNKILPLPLRYIMLQSIYNEQDISKAPEFRWLTSVYSPEKIKEEKADTVIVHYAGSMGKPWLLKKPPMYYAKVLDTIPYWFKVMNQYNRIVNYIFNKLKRIKNMIIGKENK